MFSDAHPVTVLAQSVPTSLFVWLGVLVGVVLVGGAVALVVRKRTLFDRPADAASFMEELRSARDRGELSAEEFDRVRAKMSARLAAGVRRGEASRVRGPDRPPQ